MTISDLDCVVYYASYMVLEHSKDTDNKILYNETQVLTEEEYQKIRQEYGGKVKVGIGASAVRELLTKIDITLEAADLHEKVKKTNSDAERSRLVKRLRVVEAFQRSKVKPEWMVLTILPVLPPDLRPLVPLEGGRFATSDLNDLYRRIINRNNRLKRITEIRAPESIVNHEKRLLHEAVDALIDNGRRTRPVVGSNNPPVKSLSPLHQDKTGPVP